MGNDKIPDSVEHLIQMAESIIQQHTEEGPNSPLNPADIAKMSFILKKAKENHEEGEKYRLLSQNAYLARDNALGINGRCQNEDSEVKRFIVTALAAIERRENEW